MIAKPNLLLDLDGTLTDPAKGFVASINHALTLLGREPQPADKLRRYIGPPLEVGMTAILGTDDMQLLGAAIRLYRDRYGRIGLFENALYPGIVEMLVGLTRSGYRLYLATSKPRVLAERIIEHFSLRRYFSTIHGSELDGRLAGKIHLIAHILETEQLASDRCLMIGDRQHDAIGARTNNVEPIGVLWGYGSQDELAQAGVIRFCATPDALAELLASGL